MSLKILVVDDSQTDRDKLTSIVNSKGYMVVTANTGAEGIELAKKEMPDLIFLDIVMPGESGYGACRTIKKDPITKDIPVYFVTSKNQKADHVMGGMQGASGHIGKPFSEDEILQVLAKF
ncbi:MAG: PleD family two-component system response regulator [Marinicellaceae bacterium]